jgi:hypothetical protein
LPRLVLRPAVERGGAEAFGLALLAVRPRGGAAAVVAIDLGSEIGLAVLYVLLSVAVSIAGLFAGLAIVRSFA